MKILVNFKNRYLNRRQILTFDNEHTELILTLFPLENHIICAFRRPEGISRYGKKQNIYHLQDIKQKGRLNRNTDIGVNYFSFGKGGVGKEFPVCLFFNPVNSAIILWARSRIGVVYFTFPQLHSTVNTCSTILSSRTLAYLNFWETRIKMHFRWISLHYNFTTDFRFNFVSLWEIRIPLYCYGEFCDELLSSTTADELSSAKP